MSMAVPVAVAVTLLLFECCSMELSLLYEFSFTLLVGLKPIKGIYRIKT